MTDIADAPRRAPAQNEQGAGFDLPRAAFWTATAIGASGAGVAIAGGPAVGPVGAVLLIGVAMTGLVFLMWLTGLGKYVGLYPARGAAEAAAFVVSRSEFALLDALEEPALVAENGATPLAANAAYLSASQAAGALGESARPPAVDRLFGADPLVSAPMYRLANAAKRSQSRREILPAARFGRTRGASRYEVSVAPMQGGRTLWRLRDLGAAAPEEAAAADARRLFMEDAPIGFFAAAPDGRVLYANKALRAACGVGDDADEIKFRDLLKDEPARLLRRDRKGAPVRVG
ncbi:MAG: hybrid sensor histidine kinase/response regulator, partial [Hyphomonadaceae bacterium]